MGRWRWLVISYEVKENEKLVDREINFFPVLFFSIFHFVCPFSMEKIEELGRKEFAENKEIDAIMKMKMYNKIIRKKKNNRKMF